MRTVEEEVALEDLSRAYLIVLRDMKKYSVPHEVIYQLELKRSAVDNSLRRKVPKIFISSWLGNQKGSERLHELTRRLRRLKVPLLWKLNKCKDVELWVAENLQTVAQEEIRKMGW